MGAVSDERRDPPGPPPLVLISGDEPFLVDRAVQRTLASARRIHPDVERREAMAGGMVPGEFDDLVAPSLFAEPRRRGPAGRARSVEGARRGAVAYYGEPRGGRGARSCTTPAVRETRRWRTRSPQAARVLTCNKITKAGERLDFVRAEIRRAGGTTTPDAVAALVDAVGSDLRELASASASWWRTPAGWWTRPPCGGITAAGRRSPASRCPTRRWPATCRQRWSRCAGRPRSRRRAGADRRCAGRRGADDREGVRRARRQLRTRWPAQLGMPPWKIDRARTRRAAGARTGWRPGWRWWRS